MGQECPSVLLYMMHSNNNNNNNNIYIYIYIYLSVYGSKFIINSLAILPGVLFFHDFC